MTDKPAIDSMTKQTCQSPSTVTPRYASDDNGDLESVDSRYETFAAAPTEFRTLLPVHTKIEHSGMSLNENKQSLSNQNPTSVSKISAEKTAAKVPLHPSAKLTLPPNTKAAKESLLKYGREISDLIIGSHSSLSIFISMFNEWKQSRLELISHFQHLQKNLKESSGKFNKYKDMLNIAKNAAVAAVAHPVASGIISVLTNLFSIFLSTTEKRQAEVEDSNDVSIAAMRDTSASYDLYMSGLQCGQHFEETVKFIEEFHANVGDHVIFENDSPEIATFIRGVLEYRPRHRIFYKKLHRCFQELLQNCSSEFGKQFCEPFLLYSPGTIDVVEFLNWRFRPEDFNGESVRFELEQIENLIQDSDITIKYLSVRIQTCVGALQDELNFF